MGYFWEQSLGYLLEKSLGYFWEKSLNYLSEKEIIYKETSLLQGDPLVKEKPFYYEILHKREIHFLGLTIGKSCGELLGLCIYFVENSLG